MALDTASAATGCNAQDSAVISREITLVECGYPVAALAVPYHHPVAALAVPYHHPVAALAVLQWIASTRSLRKLRRLLFNIDK